MYLGIVVNNNDPEKRGRVQIFIPHIMPALYDGWNKDGNDIDITCVGNNMINGLNGDKIQLLRQILPWAESASPICGASAPGNLITTAGKVLAGAAAGFLKGGAGGAVKGGVEAYYNQSPVSQPSPGAPPANGAASSTGTAAAADYAASFVGKSNPFGDANHGGLYGDVDANGNGIGSPNPSGTPMSCARFVNLALANAGVTGSSSPAARSFEGMGTRITDPSQVQKGDIVVVSSAVSNSGSHVGIAGTNPNTGNLSFISNPGTASTITAHDMSSNYVSNNFQYAIRLSQPDGGAGAQSTPQSQTVANGEWRSVSGETVGNIHATPTGNINASDPEAENYGYPDPTVQDNSSQGGTSAAAALSQAQGAGTLTQVVNGPKANEISDDSNGNPYSLALEGGGGAGDTNTSLTDSNRQSIDAMKIPYIAVANKADIGKPFAVSINGGPPVACIGADSSTSRGNGAVLGTPAAAGVNNYHGEISTAAMIAAGGGVTQNSSGLLTGTTLGQGATMSIAPITDGSIPSFSPSNPPTPEQLQQYYGSQLTSDQQAQLQKMTDNAAAKSGQSGTFGKQVGAAAGYNGAGAATTSMVQNTSPHGPPATQNLNNTAKGLFTYPSAGAMVWTFFREGNPLYPVYFAASYSAEEWKSAYGYGSPGPGYTPESDENGISSRKTIANFGVGGFMAQEDHHPTDPTKTQRSMMFFGEDGSNMFMGKGYHQIFSKFDRRDQVEGDRWNTTLGHKEDWVQGDHNHVTMGDVFIKIGNCSQPAVDAVTRIQELIKKGHKPLTDLK
jgi:hypothetical protein